MRPPLNQPLAREQCLLADFSDVLGKNQRTCFVCLNIRLDLMHWILLEESTLLTEAEGKSRQACSLPRLKLPSANASSWWAAPRACSQHHCGPEHLAWVLECGADDSPPVLFLPNHDDLPDSPSLLWAGISGNAFNKAKASTALLLRLCSIKVAQNSPCDCG